MVHYAKEDAENLIQDFSALDENSFRNKYREKSDSRDWTYSNAKNESKNATIQRIDYRPFDKRFILYTSKSKGILSYPRNEIMRHMFLPNFGLLICKQQSTFNFQHVFITKSLSDKCSVSLQTKEASYQFPLYLYPDTGEQMQLEGVQTRTPNLNMDIVQKIEQGMGLKFVPEKSNSNRGENLEGNSSPLERPGEAGGVFAPIDLLDYIYAVLHSPTYREKYKEFLKIDFPRVPYPKDSATFWKLVGLGGHLRQIHLLEHPVLQKLITQYPVAGNNIVEKVTAPPSSSTSPSPSKGGELVDVYINEAQYFANVPVVAWNFYIGGYQPAQKWLKDRKGRPLEFDDILHYQKIIVALSETDRLMKEIEKVEVE